MGYGQVVDEKFNLLYTGILLLRIGKVKKGMLTFINERNCITTRDLVLEVDSNKKNYVAQAPPCPEETEYNILSVFYSVDSGNVAAWYGIIKVSYKIQINRITLHKVVYSKIICLKYHLCRDLEAQR